MTGLARQLAWFTVATLVSGCGIFSDKDPEAEPAKLIDFDTKVPVKRAWSRKLGKDAEFLRVALQPVGDGARVYAASHDGRVSALDPDSGREIWQTKLDVDLAAGPGVGQGVVAVVSVDGDVITLESDTGAERWRRFIAGESLAIPLITADNVLVQTVDNQLRALSLYDGSERWSIEQQTPALTIRGSTSPVNVGGNVVTGFDNGRLVAVDISSGDVQWDSMISPPAGRSDLDRLADVDGDLAVVGQDVYAAGYQGRVASLAAESGQVLWARELSSYVGVSADWNNLYTTLDTGEIVALNRRSGAEVWRQNALLRREPTVPVSFRTTAVVGDFEGYLHFFSNIDGEPVARVRAGKEAITGAPVVIGNRLFVQSDDGTLSSWYVVEPERPERAPDVAEEGA